MIAHIFFKKTQRMEKFVLPNPQNLATFHSPQPKTQIHLNELNLENTIMQIKLPSLTHWRSIVMALFLIPFTANCAGPQGKAKNPDFTTGDPIPNGYTHDWNLGPTGMRGWIFSKDLATTQARQILVTKVAANSPADGKLNVGDVILGIDNHKFTSDARVQFGKAITQAETKELDGNLNLLLWRNGKEVRETIKLAVLGSYSPTAPFDCPKSKMIMDTGFHRLAANMQKSPNQGHPLVRSLNALALLASGDEKHHPLVAKQVELLSQYDQYDGMVSWIYGYVNLLLAEYIIATGGTEAAKQALQRNTKTIIAGQSFIGTWGHGLISPETKKLGGYGMMNITGVPLAYSLAMTRQANIEVPGLAKTIKRQADFLRFFTGAGSIPYGDHRPWIQTHGDNGKNEMTALFFDLGGEGKTTEYFSKMAVACHGNEREMGHTGNFFNITWALPGVSRLGPHATGAWLKEYSWYFDLARQWDGSFQHQGPPQTRPDSYRNWDATGAFLLGYAQCLKKTYFTGKKKSSAKQITAKEAIDLVNCGRGWSLARREKGYDNLTKEDLLRCLASWSPVVRDRASTALGRRKVNVSAELLNLLQNGSIEAKHGACQAIKVLRGKAANCIPALLDALNSENLWLRIHAGEALAKIGPPAKVAIPTMLKRLADEGNTKDPRKMEQRFLCHSLFNRRDGLLSRSIEGVDKVSLRKAIQAGLKNQDGRARSSVGQIFQRIPFEELQPLFPSILEAIKEPSPSGIMFADGVRMSGLRILTHHRVKEAIKLLPYYARYQKQHGSQERIKEIMNLLVSFGTHAQGQIPTLEKLAHYFEHEEKNFPKRLMKVKAEAVKSAITKIKSSKVAPPLKSIQSK